MCQKMLFANRAEMEKMINWQKVTYTLTRAGTHLHTLEGSAAMTAPIKGTMTIGEKLVPK